MVGPLRLVRSAHPLRARVALRRCAPLAALVALSVGCTAAPAETEQATTADAPAPLATPSERRATSWVRGLVKAAAIDAAQRSEITRILEWADPERYEERASAAEAFSDYQYALAGAVRRGEPPAAPTESDEVTLEAHASAHAERAERALDELHGTLSQSQRFALVTALLQEKDERQAQRTKAKRGGDCSQGKRGTYGLALDAEQRSELKALLAEARASTRAARKERESRLRAGLMSFTLDGFEARDLDLKGEIMSAMREHRDSERARLTALLTVIDEEQRVELALRLEERAERALPDGSTLRRGVARGLR